MTTIRGLLSLALLCIPAAWAGATPLFPGKKDAPAALPIPWQDMTERAVAIARPLVEKPTLTARGPAETFYGSPEHYHYFLDHPDHAVAQWRKIGAKCVGIMPRGQGQYGWTDELGSELVWETVHRGPGVRVWFAEGKVRPGPVMPLVPVKAILVLVHAEAQAKDGRPVIRHQAELFVQTDSKTAAALTKLMGPSARVAAEQGMSQLQLFFAGLSWYAHKHPDEAPAMLRPAPSQAAQAASPPR